MTHCLQNAGLSRAEVGEPEHSDFGETLGGTDPVLGHGQPHLAKGRVPRDLKTKVCPSGKKKKTSLGYSERVSCLERASLGWGRCTWPGKWVAPSSPSQGTQKQGAPPLLVEGRALALVHTNPVTPAALSCPEPALLLPQASPGGVGRTLCAFAKAEELVLPWRYLQPGPLMTQVVVPPHSHSP